MKLLYTLALCAAAMSAQAQTTSTTLETFELEPAGCLFSVSQGSCVIQNRGQDSLFCKIGIAGKTERGLNVGNTREVEIGAGRFETVQVFVADGDKLISAAPSAKCTRVRA